MRAFTLQIRLGTTAGLPPRGHLYRFPCPYTYVGCSRSSAVLEYFRPTSLVPSSSMPTWRARLWAALLLILTVADSAAAGGGGQVTAAGQKVALGSGNTCGTVTFSVAGPAVVRIEMWYLMGGMPGGSWSVGGPGSQQITLGNNLAVFSPQPPPTQCGQPVSLFAVGVSGTFPVWVSYN
jgi:hypothetical protein